MDIRALIFDINGTLIDIETDERMEEAYRAIGHFLTYQGITLHRGDLLNLYFQIMKEQFGRSTEKYPEFDVVAVWREIVERHSTENTLLLPPEKLNQIPLFLAELQRGISRKRLSLFPRVEEVLIQLKERYPLGVVSDGQSAWVLPELRAVGIDRHFCPVIVSGDYGYRKPDIRLFQKALDHLQVRSDQAIYIGNDCYRDIFGARQLGIKTILFRHANDMIRPNEAEPDYIIRDFAEILPALDFFKALPQRTQTHSATVPGTTINPALSA
jgi:putative hydrolase of the HAD superfamily